jgi:hypothetical protein
VGKQFHPAEGDYLKAEAAEPGSLLKPVRVVGQKRVQEGVELMLCLSAEILEETRQVLLARQRRMESEVDDALEPLRSNDASSQRLHMYVVPFLPKGPYAKDHS